MRPRTTASIARQIEKSYLKSKRQLEESMEGLPKTCKAYLERVLALARLAQNFRDERASRGLDPVNLGAATKIRYVFSATIDPQSGPVDEERQKFNDQMDAEYSSQVPPAPAALYPNIFAGERFAPEPAAPAVKKSKAKKGKQ